MVRIVFDDENVFDGIRMLPRHARAVEADRIIWSAKPRAVRHRKTTTKSTALPARR